MYNVMCCVCEVIDIIDFLFVEDNMKIILCNINNLF